MTESKDEISGPQGDVLALVAVTTKAWVSVRPELYAQITVDGFSLANTVTFGG